MTCDLEKERELFEAWWRSRGMHTPFRSLVPGDTRYYEDPIAENGWKAWVVRASLEDHLVIHLPRSHPWAQISDEQFRAIFGPHIRRQVNQSIPTSAGR